MVTRIGTKQRKTRHKLKQSVRTKGKVSLSRYFQEFEDGDTVNLKIHPAVQKGRFFPRFHGHTGKISGKKGACYQVTIKDGGKVKQLYVHPIHLNKH
jgi:large subunit ribosomal protein L21e